MREPERLATSKTTTKIKIMKKTLIAILALGSAAMGVEQPITLTMPESGVDHGSHGWLSANGALTHFISQGDGGYQFSVGGAVGLQTNEGVLMTSNNIASVQLCPRSGAQGEGEVIVLSGTELIGKGIDSFTLSLSSSSNAGVGGYLALTLAVVENSGTDGWVVLNSSTSSLSIGESATVELDLDPALNWSEDYKVVAMMDNSARTLTGGAASFYTLSDIQVQATVATPPVPEPTTGSLSLLALAGLCARRRKK